MSFQETLSTGINDLFEQAREDFKGLDSIKGRTEWCAVIVPKFYEPMFVGYWRGERHKPTYNYEQLRAFLIEHYSKAENLPQVRP